MCKCAQVVLFRTSVYFAFNKLILWFSYSFHVPCNIFFNVYFYTVRSISPFLFNWSQSKLSVKWVNSFFKKIFFCSFQNGHIQNVILTLINVVKLDVENNNIASRLSNVVNISVEKDSVDLTLFNIANFNVYIHNVVSTLIWQCPALRATSYHPNNNFETMLKGFLDIGECC